MRMGKIGLGLLILICSLYLVGHALAANGFAIGRSVIGGGGEEATGGGYILTGTIGEPVASGMQLDTAYGLSSGFWWPRQFSIYLPLVQRS